MAKSKSGGTRSYLRGRIGADVYSIGKDGKGKKQQVVRSLAEVVSNPQTTAQMRGRMIMSTVMQAQSALAQIVDHSFDGVPAGQPSLSEFIRRNYALIKADVAAHPNADAQFGLNKYQQKGMMVGAYQISSGKVEGDVLSKVFADASSITFLPATEGKTTFGAILDFFGCGIDGYITMVYQKNDCQDVYIIRLHPKADTATTQEVTADTFLDFFTFEGNAEPEVSSENNGAVLAIGIKGVTGATGAAGIIITAKENGQYIHSTSIMEVGGANSQNESVALPTYPTGTERFLNGGEL